MMKIAVIGAGQMGNGIAQVAASAGYEVLMIDINSNPITLLRKGIIIQDVRIRNAQFNIRKAEAAEKNNLQLMLDKLFEKDNPQKEDKASKPFQLGVEHIYLEDVLFEKDL